MFTPEQPDLNWNHPDVRREHEEILKFWFDRGVAGVRIDSAALLIKDADLPEVGEKQGPGEHPTEDRDELHDVYRSWRAVADSYPGTRVLVGEIWVPDIDRFTAYLRPDEMHTAFNFDFLARPWGAASFRDSIEQTLAAHAPVGAPSTWVLSNHDVTRPVTRYGREDTAFAFLKKRFGVPTDPEVGRNRARAAALLVAALPGSLYIYQGDELGLPEVEDLPLELIEDPMHYRSGGIDPVGTDAACRCRGRATTPPFGFSPDGAGTWLPQPAEWSALTVEAQQRRSRTRRSTSTARRCACAASSPSSATARSSGGTTPSPAPPTCSPSAAARGFACVVNTGDDPGAAARAGTTILLVERTARRHGAPSRATPQRGCASTTRVDGCRGIRAATKTTPTTEGSAPRG